MENNSAHITHSTKTKGLLSGILLILAGIIFLGFNFGWIDPDLKRIIFSWPMIFVIFAVFSFVKKEYLGFLFWLALGIFFLLPKIASVYPDFLPGIDRNFVYYYWPVFLIIVGLGLILRINPSFNFRKRRRLTKEIIEGLGGRIERNVVFGGSENIFLDPVFHGGEINAIFGGVVLDLRKTTLPEGETLLQIDVVFGGVSLYIPDEWLVTSKFDTVMGGFSDKRMISQITEDKTRKLILTGDLIFGGCEIK